MFSPPFVGWKSYRGCRIFLWTFIFFLPPFGIPIRSVKTTLTVKNPSTVYLVNRSVFFPHQNIRNMCWTCPAKENWQLERDGFVVLSPVSKSYWAVIMRSWGRHGDNSGVHVNIEPGGPAHHCLSSLWHIPNGYQMGDKSIVNKTTGGGHQPAERYQWCLRISLFF